MSTLPNDSIIRNAFALEACANILGGAMMLVYPAKCLSYFLPTSARITPVATCLIQWLAALVLGLTPQLLIAIPESGKNGRPMVYYTLGAGEAFAILVMAWQTGTQSGLSPTSLWIACGVMGLALLWRLFVIIFKFEWFGLSDARKRA